MSDLESKVCTLHASCVVKTVETNAKWSCLGKDYFNTIPYFTILKFNFIQIDSFPVLKKVSKFYQDVIVNCKKLKLSPKSHEKEDLLNQILWCNRPIKSLILIVFFIN